MKPRLKQSSRWQVCSGPEVSIPGQPDPLHHWLGFPHLWIKWKNLNKDFLKRLTSVIKMLHCVALIWPLLLHAVHITNETYLHLTVTVSYVTYITKRTTGVISLYNQIGMLCGKLCLSLSLFIDSMLLFIVVERGRFILFGKVKGACPYLSINSN